MPATNSRNLVISASKCLGKRIYSIGPFGTRVSFASQQRRALNLIWALKTTAGEWPEVAMPTVAVIGGGVAGAAVAAALRVQGCAVWIYEASGALLTLQRGARHRLVHPTVNFWPEEPLSWTTCFPFMDWHADACPQVLETVLDYWNEWFEGKVSGVRRNKRFSGFGRSRGERIELNFVDGSTETADMVFLATGFGMENDLVGPEGSYWHDDGIDDVHSDPQLKWVVSGTGDGGLIDALRLTYPGFMANELALKVLYLDDRAELRKEVERIERKAQDTKGKEARAAHYHRHYTSVAQNLSQGAKCLLPQLVDRKKVTLVGKLRHPYDLTSAPIHKIIMAYAMLTERLDYQRGKLVANAAGGHDLEQGHTVTTLYYDRIIIRHGARPPIWSFLSRNEVKRLQREQIRLGDYLDIDQPRDGSTQDEFYTQMPFAPGRREHADEFAYRRVDQARTFMRNRFNVGLARNFDRYEIVADEKDRAALRDVVWPIPTELFGITLDNPARVATYMRDLS